MISWFKHLAARIRNIIDEPLASSTEVGRGRQPKPPPSAPARTTTPDASPRYQMPFDDVPW